MRFEKYNVPLLKIHGSKNSVHLKEIKGSKNGVPWKEEDEGSKRMTLLQIMKNEKKIGIPFERSR